MQTESLLLNLIINYIQPKLFHWSCFLGMSKLWLKEKNVVILFPCLSALQSRIKGISGFLSPCLPTYLPTFLLQLLYIAQQIFCDAYIPPLCQNPLETRLPLVVIDCHALFIAPKDWEEPASQSDWNKVHLKGLTVAGTTMACWSTDSAIHSRGRLNNSVATAALQFKYKVGPMAGDHKRRGRIGIQGVGKERDNS